MLPCSQDTNINKSCEWCSGIFQGQHQLDERSHKIDEVDGGANGREESSTFSVCGEREHKRVGMVSVTKSRKFFDRTQHTVSPGDSRQVALFCFLWDRAASSTQGTLGGDDKEGLCSSVKIDEASSHRYHKTSQHSSLEELISNGCGVRESAFPPSVGSVGWAGVANILTTALARRRAFYKNPCTCEECLLYTATNAKPGSLYKAPVITTEAVGKVRPLGKGGKEDAATTSAAASSSTGKGGEDVGAAGNCAPAFSHRSIFIDQTPQSRFLLACGGGLHQIYSDMSVAKQEVEAAATAILNPLAESLDAACSSVDGIGMRVATSSKTERRESRAADAAAAAKIFSSSSFVARKSATRAQYFAKGLLTAPHSTHLFQKKPTVVARRKVGTSDERAWANIDLDEEKDIEDDPYAISKIPPNALPFVTKYLQHNRPLTLLRFSTQVAGGVGGTVASDLVACAARSIGWHQHLLGEQLRELDTRAAMVERLKEWARTHRDTLISNLFSTDASETELLQKGNTNDAITGTSRSSHTARNSVNHIDSFFSAFTRELDLALLISHSANGHESIRNDYGATTMRTPHTSESDSPPTCSNSRCDSRLDDSVGSRLTYEGVSAVAEWVLKDLSSSASDALTISSSNHLSSRLLITNYRQEEKRRSGRYDHRNHDKGGERGTSFSCDGGFSFEEDGGLSILGIILECLTETIFGIELIEVGHSSSHCDTLLSRSETTDSRRQSTMRRLASAIGSFAHLERHMLAAMAVEQHTNNPSSSSSSQSTRAARNSKDSMMVVMDGLDLLLSPIANIYRPTSVAIWNARDSPPAISSAYRLYQIRSHHHYLRVGSSCTCSNDDGRCFSCNGKDNTELGPDTLLSSDAIMRHILLSQQPSSFSAGSLLSPSKAKISEVCIGLSKVSRSLLLTLSSLCPTLTVLVLDGVEGWSELAPRGRFTLVKRGVGRPPGLVRLEHSSHVDISARTTPPSPWFLLAGLLGLGRCWKPSYDDAPHSTPLLEVRSPPLKTLIISNILGAFSGREAKEVPISGWWDIPTERLFELNPGFAVFADAVSASPTLEQLSLSSMGLANRELAIFWAAACGQKELVRDNRQKVSDSAPLGDQEKTNASPSHLRGFVTLRHLDLSGNRIGQRGLERAAAISDEARAEIKKSKETELQEHREHETLRTISSMDLSRNVPTMSTIDGTVLARCVCAMLAPSASSYSSSIPPSSSYMLAPLSGSVSGSIKKGERMFVPANGIGLSLRHSNIQGAELSKFFRAFRRQAPSKDYLFSHFAFSSGARDVDASLFKMLADCFTSPSPSPYFPMRDVWLNSLDLSSVDLSLASGSSGSAAYSSSTSGASAAFPTTHIFFTQILPSLLPHLSRLYLSNCGLNDAGCQRLCSSFEKVIESLRLAQVSHEDSSTDVKVGREECTAIPSGGQKSAQQSAWVLQQQQKKKIKEAASQQKKRKDKDKTDNNNNNNNSSSVSANAANNISNSNERRDYSMMGLEQQRPAADMNMNCLPLMVLRLDNNPIGLEGLRYIIKATRSGTCPRLTHLGLSSLSSGGGHTSSSSLSSSAATASSGAGATKSGLLAATTSSSSCSMAHYRFKDKFSELSGEAAAVLRYMSAQLNHSHLTILDLSANRSMISQISFVLELLRLFNNERVTEWESRVSRAVALLSKNTAKEMLSARGENATPLAASTGKEYDDEEQKERMRHLARSCVNVLPERPPTLSIVLRNIDANWEADLTHDPRFSLPFAQCIFS